MNLPKLAARLQGMGIMGKSFNDLSRDEAVAMVEACWDILEPTDARRMPYWRRPAAGTLERKISESGRLCAVCGRVKPTEFFDDDHKSCKHCLANRRLTYAQRRGGTIIDGVVHRRCPKCKQTKPRDEFSAGKVFVANCRACRQKAAIGPTKALSGKLDWSVLKFPDCPGPWSAVVLGCDYPVEVGRAS